ncbi:MAG: T9SS type A sorting domain-containing protein [Bacteroidetes bacterium]|nr:T9SS type A sorting domain-containing protein [Bacteroidota bacterium]
MKKIYTLFLGAAFWMNLTSSNAQTTAMNYDFVDCNGNPQSLFADLDAGKAVIIEFFMTSCSPCIDASADLEIMKTGLMAEFPGMIKAYAFGFTNTYTCSTINSWVTTNGVTSIPADSGALQVAYYGGMGMPTIVVLGGGTAHTVLGSPYLSYTSADTTIMATDIRNFLNGTGVTENNLVSGLKLFPNPAADEVKISFDLKEITNLKIELYDISGRLVTTVLDKKNQNGLIIETLNTSAYADGVYIVKINSNETITQQKLNIIH